MTPEFLPDDEEKKEAPPTCEELLARLPELPHVSSSTVTVEPRASALSPYKPKKTEVKETGKKEDKA